MIDTSLFPYENFTVRLEIPLENRIAWFQDDYYLQKYIERTKLKSKDIKVLYRDGKPTKSSKTDKKSLQQRTKKADSGSSGTNRRNTKDLDTVGPTKRTRKSKTK
jgi:hypothetical protein